MPNADAGVIVLIGGYFEQSDLDDFNTDIIEQGTYKDELYTVAAMDSAGRSCKPSAHVTGR